MLSFRAIARSAPRSAYRIASYSSHSSLRPTFRLALRSPRISTLTPRCFSTSLPRLDSASQELAAKLENEITLEGEENSTPADSDNNISAFLSQNPHWELHDVEGTQEILLTRKYDDEDVTVSFSIADFNTPMMEPEDADEALMDEDEDVADTPQSGGGNTKGSINQGRTSGGNIKVAPEDRVAPADREELRDEEDEDDAEAQPAFPANINVLVQRASKGALRVNLVAADGVFTIQSVTHIPDSKASASKSPSDLLHHSPEAAYTGPPFQQLDEEVQSLIEQYLDVRGINTALALFIPEYIDVKEQREYLGWLGRMKEFVE